MPMQFTVLLTDAKTKKSQVEIVTFFLISAQNIDFGFSHYVNVSVLIKFSQNTSFYPVNYHKFSIKSYVFDVY